MSDYDYSDIYDDTKDRFVKRTINNLDKKFIDLKDSVYEQIKYALRFRSDEVSSDTADLLPGLDYAIELVDFYQKQNKRGDK